MAMIRQALRTLHLIVGWICIIGGLIVSISPIPFGFVIVIAGIILVGPRDRGLRMVRAWWNRAIRSLASSSVPLVSALAKRIITFQSSIEMRIHQWTATRTTPRVTPQRAVAEE
ncbi:MAG: hypothetical protein C0183_21095 [Roseiflexus castenholzii]|nr:MAG: hypothetical protein C0183_21095 [Roseiflexus castenholzii]